jgi:hypothetical protein
MIIIEDLFIEEARWSIYYFLSLCRFYAFEPVTSDSKIAKFLYSVCIYEIYACISVLGTYFPCSIWISNIIYWLACSEEVDIFCEAFPTWK